MWTSWKYVDKSDRLSTEQQVFFPCVTRCMLYFAIAWFKYELLALQWNLQQWYLRSYTCNIWAVGTALKAPTVVHHELCYICNIWAVSERTNSGTSWVTLHLWYLRCWLWHYSESTNSGASGAALVIFELLALQWKHQQWYIMSYTCDTWAVGTAMKAPTVVH